MGRKLKILKVDSESDVAKTFMDKLSTDLNLAQVYFATSLVTVAIDEMCIPLLRRRFVELMYHNYPPLPLTEEDKRNKLIFPSRTAKNKVYEPYLARELKTFE